MLELYNYILILMQNSLNVFATLCGLMMISICFYLFVGACLGLTALVKFSGLGLLMLVARGFTCCRNHCLSARAAN